MKHNNPNYIYVDGGLKNYSTPPPRGQGYAKTHLTQDNPLSRIECTLPTTDNTNNEAELFALLFGITQAIKNKSHTIYSDSEWCIKACKGEYAVEEQRLKLMVSSIHALIDFYKIELIWVPREGNLAT